MRHHFNFVRTGLVLRVAMRLGFSMFFGFACSGSVAALPVFSGILERLGSSDIAWGPTEVISAAGVPLDIAPFSSSLSPAAVAESFSRPKGLFQRVLTTPGRVVLSGLDGSNHVIAAISKQGAGSQGYVSAMRTAENLQGQRGARPFEWMPEHAVPVFSYTESKDRNTLRHEAYRLKLNKVALQRYLSERLRNQGWQSRGGLDRPDQLWRWSRHDEELTLHVAPASQQLTLFIQHSRERAQR